MVLFLWHQQRVEDPVLWHTNQTLVCSFMHHCSFSQQSLADFFPCCFHSLTFPSPFLSFIPEAVA